MDNDFDLHEEQECLPDNAEADNAAKNSRKETRGRKNAVVWSEQKELALVTLVLKHKAYKKTDKKKEEKWAAVKQELFQLACFQGDPECSVSNIAKKYERMESDISKRFSLTQEGANLSGLPEHCSEMEHTIYSMVVEKLNTQREKEELSKKEQARENSMLTHETNILDFMSGCTPSATKKRKMNSGSSSGSSSDMSPDYIGELMMKKLDDTNNTVEREYDVERAMLEMEERKAELEMKKSQVRMQDASTQAMQNIAEAMKNFSEFVKSNTKN